MRLGLVVRLEYPKLEVDDNTLACVLRTGEVYLEGSRGLLDGLSKRLDIIPALRRPFAEAVRLHASVDSQKAHAGS